jgi:acyl-coenzyme A synthetase/AMP-(fatty) acid ligase
MIKTGGANVAPREVELLLESLDEVKEAYVVGIPDPALGQVVAAAVVPWEGRCPEPEKLRARLRSELSAFKVPRHIVVLAPDEIPRTDSAKIRKPLLAELISARISGR